MSDLFKHTGQICFELSNMCNKACKSPRCPLAFYGKVGGEGKVVLPTYIVDDTLNNLAEYGFKGHVCFNIYNEPTIDPRLMQFIWMVKEKLKDKGIPFVITNGTYVNQRLINEMVVAGLGKLWISCYSDAVYKEFKSYKYPEKLSVDVLRYPELVELQDTYTKPYIDSTVPCYAPLNVIVIRCNGDVHLCCRDFETRHSFGNLYIGHLINILKEGEMHKLYEELSQGKRTLDICRRCHTAF